MNIIKKIKKSVSKISPFWLFLGIFAFMNLYLKKSAFFGAGAIIGIPLIIIGVLAAPIVPMFGGFLVLGGLIAVGGGFALDKIFEALFSNPILLSIVALAALFIYMKTRYK